MAKQTEAQRGWFTRSITLAAAGLTLTAGVASAQVPFDNFNIDGVVNGPRSVTQFIVPANTKAEITQLVNYHWNNGQGARPGSISLKGKKGYFQTFTVSGAGGSPETAWIANVSVTLDPDIYTILDSDLFTWSQNFRSGGRGFARVYGRLVAAPSQPSQPPSSSPGMCPTAYPNCTCKGPGCAHPDLTAYGGNGPFGMTAPKFIHKKFSSSAFYWIAGLPASTSVSSWALLCSNSYHGSLMLLDDEPWYYYYSGYYARFGCAR